MLEALSSEWSRVCLSWETVERIYTTSKRCDSTWISFNATAFEADLQNKLFGQHIASSIILKAVSGFMSNENPKKPLVLSLHGRTGTGKSFVSKLIAENIFKVGTDGSFIHVVPAHIHFPHESKLETYKTQLQQWIKDNVTNCERSIFVFDKMDKMHPGLIDSIKSYLDYYFKLDGVSYRKAVFIFLSNTGADIITQKALELWREGRDREEIELKDLQTSLSESAFNNIENGFWHSSLIDENLVDFFIPFLPLEHRHVVQCVMAEMRARNIQPDKKVADQVARGLNYFPKFDRVFSSQGCKTVESNLNFYM
ncbi:torsin-1A-like [Centropristis striata]|uniref:torsin-1A-like n=1 Tax=Centropristis striata TaxID=184440 RepID=UPI0027E055B5|nr:torsin-1A-like [Centropristis striata]